MKKAIQTVFEQEIPHWREKKLLLAHSGGVDSSVLAHLLKRLSLDFAVAHCNFQLRGEASEQDCAMVKNWCAKNDIPFFSMRFVLPQGEGSIQLKARTFRYTWFYELLDVYSFDLLLTAHHLNDQLETFLMHTGRGTGLSGLLGIPSHNRLFRPLLSFPKETLMDYAVNHKIKWREDASNTSTVYWRNALRHEVVKPLLASHPQFLDNFQTTLNNLRDTQTFVNTQLEVLQQRLFVSCEDYIKINIKQLQSLPNLAFCLHAWFAPMGFHPKEVEKLLVAQTGSELKSANHRLIRNREFLLLVENISSQKEQEIYSWDLKTPLTHPISLKSVTQKEAGPNCAVLNPTHLKMPLKLRKYKRGDYFYPQGMKGKKKLSKFFKDEKFSLLEKENQWLLCSQEHIVWVIGKRLDERYAASAETQNPLILQTQ